MKNVLSAFVTALVLSSLAGPAHATRTIAGYDYPDRCANIKGTQTALDIAAGYWQFKVSTPRPDDCRKGWRARISKRR